MTPELTDPALFIERTFGAADGEIVCRFHWPRPEGRDFRCDYEIVWPGRRRASYAMGVDAVQALLLAMQTVHVDVLVAGKSKPVTWLGQQDLGLPLSDYFRDLVEDQAG